MRGGGDDLKAGQYMAFPFPDRLLEAPLLQRVCSTKEQVQEWVAKHTLSGSEASRPERFSRPFCCRVSRSTCSPSWNFVFSCCRFTVTNLGMPADIPVHHTTRALVLCLHASHIADLLAATTVRSGLSNKCVITTAADVSTVLLLQGMWVMA